MNSESSLYESEFLRSYNTLKINYKKGWSKINFEAEENIKTNLGCSFGCGIFEWKKI